MPVNTAGRVLHRPAGYDFLIRYIIETWNDLPGDRHRSTATESKIDHVSCRIVLRLDEGRAWSFSHSNLKNCASPRPVVPRASRRDQKSRQRSPLRGGSRQIDLHDGTSLGDTRRLQ